MAVVCIDKLAQKPLVLSSHVGGHPLPDFSFAFLQALQVSLLLFLLFFSFGAWGKTSLNVMHFSQMELVYFLLHVDIRHFGLPLRVEHS